MDNRRGVETATNERKHTEKKRLGRVIVFSKSVGKGKGGRKTFQGTREGVQNRCRGQLRVKR